MATHTGHWVLKGYGTWAVERSSDGLLLGRVGLWEPEGWPGVELGWKLCREAWGHGYAQEAARGAMKWAWSSLDLPRLISLIDPGNADIDPRGAALGYGARRCASDPERVRHHFRDRPLGGLARSPVTGPTS